MVNQLKCEKIDIPKHFQVGSIIAKLPTSWKGYRKKLLHDFSRKHMGVSGLRILGFLEIEFISTKIVSVSFEFDYKNQIMIHGTNAFLSLSSRIPED